MHPLHTRHVLLSWIFKQCNVNVLALHECDLLSKEHFTLANLLRPSLPTPLSSLIRRQGLRPCLHPPVPNPSSYHFSKAITAQRVQDTLSLGLFSNAKGTLTSCYILGTLKWPFLTNLWETTWHGLMLLLLISLFPIDQHHKKITKQGYVLNPKAFKNSQWHP